MTFVPHIKGCNLNDFSQSLVNQGRVIIKKIDMLKYIYKRLITSDLFI